MTIDNVEVRQATNDEVTIGTVSEYDITIKECTRECDINGDGDISNVKTAWIGGTMVVDVNGSAIKHSFRYLDTVRHKKNGDENKSFASIMTALGYTVSFDADAKKLVYVDNGNGGLIPKIEGKITWKDANGNVINEVVKNKNGDATRVKITSKLSLAEGLNQDKSDLAFYNELPISYISTSGATDEDSARFTVEGVVKEVVSELNSNGGETGRYLIDIVTPNFFGVDVFPLVMLDKWSNEIDGETIEVTKEMFYDGTDESFCKVGDTVKLSGDVEAHTFGAVKANDSAKKTFGGGAQNIKSGFTRIEWTVKSGDIVDSEPYDTTIIAKALEERDIQLDKNYQKRKEDYEKAQAEKNNSTKSSPKGASANASNNPFGSPKGNPFGNSDNGTKKNPFA